MNDKTPGTATAVGRRLKPRNKRKPFNWALLLLALPGMVHVLMFRYVPMFGLVIPFKKIDYAKGILGSDWIDPWYKNFEFFFKSDTAVRLIWNTIRWNLILTLLGLVLAVALAVILYDLPATKVKIYQTCIFVPYFISWVVACLILDTFLAGDIGVIAKLCQTFGVKAPNFYLEPKYWNIIIPVVSIWKSTGQSTLFYYAALMGIDQSLFESAALDGCTKWQRIRYIMLPMLKPTISILLLLSVGSMLSGDLNKFYLLPKNSGMLYRVTDVIDTYVYRALRVSGDLAMSSAIGLFQSVVGFFLVIITNAAARKLDENTSLY